MAVLFATVVAALTLSVAAPAAADEVGLDEYDFRISGLVELADEPLEDVRLVIDGGGFSVEVLTGADGRWAVGVPVQGDYTVTLDETTLPDGIAVVQTTQEGDETPNSRDVNIGQSGSTVLNFFIGQGERNTVNLWDQIVDRFFNGLNFGLLLALAAIGLSLVFGTTGLSNFAHAELITFGALMALTFSTVVALPLWLALLIALILSAAFGWANDAGLWRPLRKRGVGLIPMMIVSIGLSLALRYVFQFFYGGETQQLPGATDSSFSIGAFGLSWVDVGSMALSVVVLLAVAFFLLRTRVGKATRAVSDNPALAAASGIDVDRVIRIVWILAGFLAGMSGIIWAYFRPGVGWDMGFQLLLLTFAAVTLGGLGTAFGALVGALIVGFFVEMSTLIIPSDTKYVGALIILILVLLVRPQGILGRKERIG
ncbi:MAG: branched-chain amino acid ABC transporter permease [Microcella pacifica]|jgi:branched-chain amino acid transport system permease protein|uniref:Branched-chain amino acid ABC transporter permease n=1 Tax=Microcella pacifica TaxID=2591847 RepID=A0A9E5MKI6_9MICO|nr:branched-chain amino acid ABC transporter permease [Microcella pacifica]MBR20938.1 branched-chain amino acid ABC transporter permease [Leifsonia sp.]NHF63169.1 branched-chain amino acid ABC transporter permease [Microcella pacifica]